MEYAQLVERLDEGFDRSSLAVWKDMSRWAVGGIACRARERAANADARRRGRGDDLAHPRMKALFGTCGSEDATFIMFCHRDHGYAPGHLDIILGQRAPGWSGRPRGLARRASPWTPWHHDLSETQ